MAAANYYVDPVGGNDTTGDGSIGTPWASVQKALNTITRNTTTGDQINVKAGGADTLTAALSLSTYGTPTVAAPLVIRGYTSTANDGGIGIIDGDDTYSIFLSSSNSNKPGVHFWDMELRNSGAAELVRLFSHSSLVNCKLHGKTSGTDRAVCIENTHNRIIGCHFYDLNPTAFTSVVVVTGSNSIVLGNTFEGGNDPAAGVVTLYIDGWAAVINNVFHDLNDQVLTFIENRDDGGSLIWGNSLYKSNGAANGIYGVYANCRSTVTGNNVMDLGDNAYSYSIYARKFSGGTETLGTIITGPGAYHNVPAPIFFAQAQYNLGTWTELDDPPFADAANGDFALEASVTTEAGGAYPAAWTGETVDTTNYLVMGAMQPEAGESVETTGISFLGEDADMYRIDDPYLFTVTTHDAATGALTDADSVPAYRVYEDETGTAILTGNMAKLDDANTTGHYSEIITLSAANGFEAGKSYSIYISAAVDSVTGATTRNFRVVAATSSVSAIADAVWDEAKSGHNSAGTFGEEVQLHALTSELPSAAPSAATIADAVWDEATSGHTTAGTFGEQAKTDIDAILADTNELQTNQGDWATADVSGLATAANLATLTGYVDTEVASILAAVDTEVAAIKAVTDNLPDSGALSSLATAAALATVAGYIDTEVAAILAAVDTEVAAIKAKTDNLPADPADDSDIDAQLAALAAYVDTEVAAILAAVDTEVAAIKAKTDNLPSDPADQSAVEAAITAATSPLATASALSTVAGNVTSILADTGTDGVVISTATAQALADAILSRAVDNVEDSADVNSLAAVILATFHSSMDGSTWTIYETDDATTFDTRAITTDADADPVTGAAA